MAKIDIDKLKQILHRNESDVQKINDILNEINLELQIEKEERDARPPMVKKQYITLIADSEGILKDRDLATWVLQIPEEDNPHLILEKIHASAYDYNSSPKGRRLPVRSVGETLEIVTAKTFKENHVWVKTKIPVLAISCDNQLPKT